jgi:hypothetical protein
MNLTRIMALPLLIASSNDHGAQKFNPNPAASLRGRQRAGSAIDPLRQTT